jgi:hypothetical protein
LINILFLLKASIKDRFNFEEVEDFLENEMDTTAPLDYDFPSLDTKTGIHLDPNRSSNGMVQNKMGYVLTNFIQMLMPLENLVHVTCSGYSSPSVAQQAAISRNYPSYTFLSNGVLWGFSGYSYGK